MDFDFTPEIDDLEKVPTDFRGLYSREGEEGPFALRSDDDGVKSAVAAIARLNQALKSERAGRKADKGKIVDLSPLQDFGESPDEIRAAIESKIEELQGQLKGGEEAKLNLDKIKADLAAAHSKETETKDKRIGALTEQLHNLLVKNQALSALGDAIDPDLAMPFITNQVRAFEEDGEYRVYVVDETGDRRYSGATGAPMTINELVKEMKSQEKFKPLFKSESPNGSGHMPSTSGRRVNVTPQKDLSPTQKIAAGLRNRR